MSAFGRTMRRRRAHLRGEEMPPMPVRGDWLVVCEHRIPEAGAKESLATGEEIVWFRKPCVFQQGIRSDLPEVVTARFGILCAACTEMDAWRQGKFGLMQLQATPEKVAN